VGRAIVGRVKARHSMVSLGVLLASTLVVLGATRTALAADEGGEGEKSSSEAPKAAEDEAKGDDGSKDEAKDDDGSKDKAKDDAFGHGGQVGLRIGILGGYRMILRYDDSPLCARFDPDKGLEQQKFCGHAAPWALTTALSFGIADWLEPYAWGRFGLESEPETYTKPALMFGAGVRVYTMSDAPFKIFIEPAIGLELEDSTTGADMDTDFALHLAAGPQFDFAKYVGASLTAGVTTTVVRYLATSLDVELAVQGRY
jgi:hypothetical protein